MAGDAGPISEPWLVDRVFGGMFLPPVLFSSVGVQRSLLFIDRLGRATPSRFEALDFAANNGLKRS